MATSPFSAEGGSSLKGAGFCYRNRTLFAIVQRAYHYLIAQDVPFGPKMAGLETVNTTALSGMIVDLGTANSFDQIFHVLVLVL